MRALLFPVILPPTCRLKQSVSCLKSFRTSRLNVVAPLRDQLSRTQALHRRDLEAGFWSVFPPDALAVKYPRAAQLWG